MLSASGIMPDVNFGSGVLLQLFDRGFYRFRR